MTVLYLFHYCFPKERVVYYPLKTSVILFVITVYLFLVLFDFHHLLYLLVTWFCFCCFFICSWIKTTTAVLLVRLVYLAFFLLFCIHNRDVADSRTVNIFIRDTAYFHWALLNHESKFIDSQLKKHAVFRMKLPTVREYAISLLYPSVPVLWVLDVFRGLECSIHH